MVNIFVAALTPRINYAFRLVFETILNDEVRFFTDADAFSQCRGVKINYSDQQEMKGLYLQPHGLLHDSHLQFQYPEMTEWMGEKVLFPVENSFLPFDLFAATFFLVSRYEEYLPGKRDSHQRFMPRHSTAGRFHFLDKPLVNIWALKLADLLESTFAGTKFNRSTFHYIPTFDIDNAWAYQHKNLFRILLSTSKDIIHGRWKTFKERFLVLLGFQSDPYDNYDFLWKVLKQFKFSPISFFLLNSWGKHDRSVSHRNIFFRMLVKNWAKTGQVGIHPSYASNKHAELLAKEIGRLKRITGQEVEHSRQHFLKITMPKTYRELIAQGIKTDYSMGYASRPGFRASIATPYFFFDILKDETTTLKICPFQVMDVTLLNYRNLRASDAIKEIKKLMEITAQTGGTFVSLWHNESLNDQGRWSGWCDVYTEMTRYAAQLRDGDKI